MDSINELLNSLSPDDMQKLQSVASSLGGNTAGAQNLGSALSSTPEGLLGTITASLGKDNEKTAFLKALRPLLSEERKQKVDEAVKFLRLMDSLPLLKGLLK